MFSIKTGEMSKSAQIVSLLLKEVVGDESMLFFSQKIYFIFIIAYDHVFLDPASTILGRNQEDRR